MSHGRSLLVAWLVAAPVPLAVQATLDGHEGRRGARGLRGVQRGLGHHAVPRRGTPAVTTLASLSPGTPTMSRSRAACALFLSSAVLALPAASLLAQDAPKPAPALVKRFDKLPLTVSLPGEWQMAEASDSS